MTGSYIGRLVRLTGEDWSEGYGLPEHGTVHIITHDPGYTQWSTGPGINPSGDPDKIFYVIPPGLDAPPEDRRSYAVEWVTFEELLDAYREAVADSVYNIEGPYNRAQSEEVQAAEAAARGALVAWNERLGGGS